MSKKALRLHWSKSKPNFGDALSPIICGRLYGGPITYAQINRCDLVAQGSLLQRKKESLLSRKIVVWGTGLIENTKPALSKHTYIAVRGYETKKCILKIPSNIVLGDPGLLAHLVVEKRQVSKTHRIGLICHYKDKGNSTVARLCERYPDLVEIDIFAPVQHIFNAILASDVIFSSAMHGLIAADALGVPNAWIQLSNQVKGGGFKFRDYYSVFGIDAVPLILNDQLVSKQFIDVIDRYQRKDIATIQEELIKCFPF